MDICEALRNADPLHYEPAMSSSDVDRIRDRVLAESRRAQRPWSPHPVLITATVASVLFGAVMLERRMPSPSATPDPDRSEPVSSTPTVHDGVPARLQLQFATRGGTRVIWVFDPAFSL